MTPYFVLLSIWIVGAIQFSSKQRVLYERSLFGLAVLLTILMVGLRYKVGGDWSTYQAIYRDISLQSLPGSFTRTEPAYAFLNWISAQVDGGVYVPNVICAFIFMLGLCSLVRKQSKPWLAMTVAVPYLVIVVGMGYTRQAAAIGVICWAISTAEHDRIWKVLAKVAFAALFHKTAILFLPILLAPVARRNILMAIVGSAAFIGLAVVALGGSSDRLVASYIDSKYQATGAAIRIGMNVVAAVTYLLLRKRFAISSYQRSTWTILSLLAIAGIFGLLFASSSVGVDRLSLFLIPLQVFTYSNIPSLPFISRRTAFLSTLAVISYCILVQCVYFFQGRVSYAWLPYRNAVLAIGDRNWR